MDYSMELSQSGAASFDSSGSCDEGALWCSNISPAQANESNPLTLRLTRLKPAAKPEKQEKKPHKESHRNSLASKRELFVKLYKLEDDPKQWGKAKRAKCEGEYDDSPPLSPPANEHVSSPFHEDYEFTAGSPPAKANSHPVNDVKSQISPLAEPDKKVPRIKLKRGNKSKRTKKRSSGATKSSAPLDIFKFPSDDEDDGANHVSLGAPGLYNHHVPRLPLPRRGAGDGYLLPPPADPFDASMGSSKLPDTNNVNHASSPSEECIRENYKIPLKKRIKLRRSSANKKSPSLPKDLCLNQSEESGPPADTVLTGSTTMEENSTVTPSPPVAHDIYSEPSPDVYPAPNFKSEKQTPPKVRNEKMTTPRAKSEKLTPPKVKSEKLTPRRASPRGEIRVHNDRDVDTILNLKVITGTPQRKTAAYDTDMDVTSSPVTSSPVTSPPMTQASSPNISQPTPIPVCEPAERESESRYPDPPTAPNGALPMDDTDQLVIDIKQGVSESDSDRQESDVKEPVAIGTRRSSAKPAGPRRTSPRRLKQSPGRKSVEREDVMDYFFASPPRRGRSESATVVVKQEPGTEGEADTPQEPVLPSTTTHPLAADTHTPEDHTLPVEQDHPKASPVSTEPEDTVPSPTPPHHIQTTEPSQPVSNHPTLIEPVNIKAQNMDPLPIKGQSMEPMSSKGHTMESMAAQDQTMTDMAIKGHTMESMAVQDQTMTDMAIKGQTMEDMAMKGQTMADIVIKGQTMESMSMRAMCMDEEPPGSPTLGLPMGPVGVVERDITSMEFGVGPGESPHGSMDSQGMSPGSHYTQLSNMSLQMAANPLTVDCKQEGVPLSEAHLVSNSLAPDTDGSVPQPIMVIPHLTPTHVATPMTSDPAELMESERRDPKQCDICGRKMSRAPDVKRHKIRVHGWDPKSQTVQSAAPSSMSPRRSGRHTRSTSSEKETPVMDISIEDLNEDSVEIAPPMATPVSMVTPVTMDSSISMTTPVTMTTTVSMEGSTVDLSAIMDMPPPAVPVATPVEGAGDMGPGAENLYPLTAQPLPTQPIPVYTSYTDLAQPLGQDDQSSPAAVTLSTLAPAVLAPQATLVSTPGDNAEFQTMETFTPVVYSQAGFTQATEAFSQGMEYTQGTETQAIYTQGTDSQATYAQEGYPAATEAYPHVTVTECSTVDLGALGLSSAPAAPSPQPMSDQSQSQEGVYQEQGSTVDVSQVLGYQPILPAPGVASSTHSGTDSPLSFADESSSFDPKQCDICFKKLSRAHDVKRHKKKIHGVEHIIPPTPPKPVEKAKPKPPVKKPETKPLAAIAPAPMPGEEIPAPVMMVSQETVAQSTTSALPVVVTVPQAALAKSTIDHTVIASINNSPLPDEAAANPPISSFDPKQCDICGKRLSRSQDVKRHKRRVHNAEVTPPAALKPIEETSPARPIKQAAVNKPEPLSNSITNDSDATNQSSLAEDSSSQPPEPLPGGSTDLTTTFQGTVTPIITQETLDSTVGGLPTAAETVAGVTTTTPVILPDSTSDPTVTGESTILLTSL